MKRGLATLILLGTLVAAATAQPPPTPEPVKFTVHPAAAPVPALKYLLLPELSDEIPGNAALLYYRTFSPEWWGNIRKPEVMDKVNKALQTPLKDLPRSDLNWLLTSAALKEVDRGSRREYIDWELAQRLREDGIGLLLPDIQGFREVAALLAVRARLEMADGHYDRAVYTLQTGFALARYVEDGPTLIQALVGVAIAQVMLNQLEDLIRQPDAPNLYWALTELPNPFADLRKPLQGEKMWLYSSLPLLRDIEKGPLPPQDQETLVKLMAGTVDEFMGWGSVDEFLGYGPKPHWTNRFGATALVMRSYPDAKRALIAEGRKPAEVEALPAAQVVVIHNLHQYRRIQDDLFKWYALPFRGALPHLKQMDEELRRARARWDGMPFLVFLPAITKVAYATVRLDRRIAALRCIEAVRLYAAAHDGKLPEALSDVTDVPVPNDPMTGEPFNYRASGDRATLSGPAPAGEQPTEHNTINYELTLQR